MWDVTGSQPGKPTLACYESATFNATTCKWDVIGSQPGKPTLACYQSAIFNASTCQWNVTGSQPAKPTLACYQSAIFNTSTCQWDVTGSQPAKPTLACYQSATFNASTCNWDVIGSQPAKPSLGLNDSATFNTNTCQWDVTSTQPATNTVGSFLPGEILIYPNPVKNILVINIRHFNKGIHQIELLDTRGVKLKEMQLKYTGMGAKENWNLSGLPAGQYFLNIRQINPVTGRLARKGAYKIVKIN
jgi:hypothetical protein